ncbi:NAD dependent epimerase/dehydratase family protein [bacterium BMS3Bbin03]|nr:NAD dependent epimerase/dehydratase family protein [bacterium BMS3Bbin03]
MIQQAFDLPEMIETDEQLDEIVSRPAPELVRSLAGLSGDIIMLGIGGKLGPDLARLALRAANQAGIVKKIYGVSRFSTPGVRKKLSQTGVETIQSDLLEPDALRKLPDVENVIFLIGRKFGTGGAECFTWAWNTYLPGLVAERFRDSKIVVLSSGNVYPFVPVTSGGADESVPPDPIGEYGQSVLGRERLFEYFSRKFNTPAVFVRLNYSNSLRYGILPDIAQKVLNGKPIDLTTGNVNIVWQGDTNTYILRSFEITDSPPVCLNLTGPEAVSVRWLAQELGKRIGKEPVFKNEPSDTALLSNAAFCFEKFGYPKVPLKKMVDWAAHWITHGGSLLNKPTHFEERKGKF